MTAVPWWSVCPTGSEISAITEVINSGYFNEGAVVKQFEKSLSDKFNGVHVVTCTSGTSALFLALRALGIGPGDLVGVPNLTFIATANAVRLAGAEVILLDVDMLTMTISESEIYRAVKIGVRAIIPVHVSGRSAWNNELRKLNSEKQVLIIEDAAEAMGSKDPETGRYLGTIGSAGIFSFSPNKIITTGQGGAVLTNSIEISNIVGRLKDQGRPHRGTGGADFHDFEGYNFKFTNIQASIGLAQLEDFDRRINFLSQLYEIYRGLISDCQHKRLFEFKTQRGEVPLWPEISFQNKSRIKKIFEEAEVGYRDVWLPISQQIPYRTNQSLENSFALSVSTLWLPSSFLLNNEQIALIARLLECKECV